MKKTKIILNGIFLGLTVAFLTTSCDSNSEIAPNQVTLPKSIMVDIPSVITEAGGNKGGRKAGRTTRQEDTPVPKGEDVYNGLIGFISLGNDAAEFIEEIITGLREEDEIDQITSFTGEDDRVKNVVVKSNVGFENKNWEHQVTVIDSLSKKNPDEGKAIQIFWNENPVQVIVIIKLTNHIRSEDLETEGDEDDEEGFLLVASENTVARINYTESGSNYDAEMEVLISGLKLLPEDPHSISVLHMFVGKKGDIVDVFGNSNHPNGELFPNKVGYNYAFVASGSVTEGVAAVELGLPPSNLNESDREVLLTKYSLKKVLTDEIVKLEGLDQATIDAILEDVSAPAYFGDELGFISGGESPGSEWNQVAVRLKNLSPYNPLETNNLVVTLQ